MESKRQQKFARLVQRELGKLFQSKFQGVFGKAFVTITGVRTTPDMGLAKIYVSVMLGEDKEVLATLEEISSQIRFELGNRIKDQRIIPHIKFYIDDSAKYAQNIDNILKDIDIPPEKEDETE